MSINQYECQLKYGWSDIDCDPCFARRPQVFFVIRLHPVHTAVALPPIQDPDPFISNDLMDGRDAFLAIAREKHYEFSSLRRAQFSTMAMLYELHNQGKDHFVYTCNHCKAHVETRYHCSVCEVRAPDGRDTVSRRRLRLRPSRFQGRGDGYSLSVAVRTVFLRSRLRAKRITARYFYDPTLTNVGLVQLSCVAFVFFLAALLIDSVRMLDVILKRICFTATDA